MEARLLKQKMEGPEAKKPNLTGIPTQMKLDFEQRSGLSFDDVRVHYSSDKPARLGALAYTQGNEVYMGPGQERHLSHELGHVVQQKAGRVRPTGWTRGLPLNDQPELEREADRAPVQCMAATGGQDVVQMFLEILPPQRGGNCGYHALARALLRFFTPDPSSSLSKDNLANELTSFAIQMGYSVIGEAFDPAALAYVGNTFCRQRGISAVCEARQFAESGENDLQSFLDDANSVVLVPYFRTGDFKPGLNPHKEKRAHWCAIDTVQGDEGTTYNLYEGNTHGSGYLSQPSSLPLSVSPQDLTSSNKGIQSEFDWGAFLADARVGQGPSALTGLDAVNCYKKNVVVNSTAVNSGPFSDVAAYSAQIRYVMDNIYRLHLSPPSSSAAPGPGGSLTQPMSLAGAVVIVKRS